MVIGIFPFPQYNIMKKIRLSADFTTNSGILEKEMEED